jgi:hypothetical protein
MLPHNIKLIGRDDNKYVVQYTDNTGPQERVIDYFMGKLIFGAIEQGKKQLRQEMKKLLED